MERARVAFGAGTLVLTALALGWFELSSVDLGYHLAYGRWMLDHGRVLSHREFSSVHPDHAFLNDKWLFEVAVAGLEPAGAAALVAARTALIVALGLVVWAAARHGRAPSDPLPWLAAVLALWLANERFELRPELPGYVFLAATLWQLERLAAGARGALATLAAIELLWVNVHGSFAFGPVLAGMRCGAALCVPGRRAEWAPLARGAAAMLAASLANPYGPWIYAYPLHMMADVGSDPHLRALITEFRPSLHPYPFDTAALLLYRIALVAVPLAAASAAWRRRDPYPLLLLALFGALSLQMRRHLALLAPVAAWLLVAGAPTVPARWRPGARTLAWLLLAAAPVAALQAWTDRLYQVEQRVRRRGAGWSALVHPRGAVELIRTERLFVRYGNSPDLGSYLAWQLPEAPPLLDNHTNAVPIPLRRQVFEILRGQRDADAFSRALGLRMWVVQLGSGPDLGLLAQLSGHPRWALVYADATAAVFLARDDPELQPRIARLESAWRAAERATPAVTLGEPAPRPLLAVSQLLSTQVAADPKPDAFLAQTWLALSCPRLGGQALLRALQHGAGDARVHLQAATYLQEVARDDALAQRYLEAALSLAPRYPTAHAQLGWLLHRRGDRAGAIRHLERARALEPTEPRHAEALEQAHRGR